MTDISQLLYIARTLSQEAKTYSDHTLHSFCSSWHWMIDNKAYKHFSTHRSSKFLTQSSVELLADVFRSNNNKDIVVIPDSLELPEYWHYFIAVE